tara:strand:- start:2811 stop:3119 length:309 start_codon:yes stop_codon:yes gene_type:complete
MTRSIGFGITVGGSKGRPTGPELRACLNEQEALRTITVPQGVVCDKNGNCNVYTATIPYCTAPRKIWTMIKTNNNWHQRGFVNSTTGGVVTGGALAARKNRC